MTIFIPSKSRAGNIRTPITEDTFVVVPASQRKEYEKIYGKSVVLPVPETVVSIGPTRNWILKYAKRHRLQKIIMMDDDLKFDKRRVDDPSKFTPTTMEDFRELRFAIYRELDSFVHVSVLAREGGNREREPRLFCSRPLRVYAYNVPVVLSSKCWFTEDPTMFMDDFDMTLKLLRKGYKNCVIADFVNGQVSSNSRGGASELRTSELQKISAEKLKLANPDFVKLVTKKTKTSWGWGERTDVVVSWKKAYESSQR